MSLPEAREQQREDVSGGKATRKVHSRTTLRPFQEENVVLVLKKKLCVVVKVILTWRQANHTSRFV